MRNQGGNEGNQCRNAENQGGNAGNGRGNVRNAGNQGGNAVRIFVFIASAKIPEREGSISPSSFYGQLPDY